MLALLLGSDSEGAEGGSSSSAQGCAAGAAAAAQPTLAAPGADCADWPADARVPTAAVAADSTEQQAAAQADHQHVAQAPAAAAPASPVGSKGGAGGSSSGAPGSPPHSNELPGTEEAPVGSQRQGMQPLELCSHGHRLSLLHFGSAEEVAVGRDVAAVCEALDAGRASAAAGAALAALRCTACWPHR